MILAAYAFLVWIVWEWHHPNPVVDIRLFQRRNFATAMFFSFTLGIVLYGTTFMIPQFLQVQLGYSAVKCRRSACRRRIRDDLHAADRRARWFRVSIRAS